MNLQHNLQATETHLGDLHTGFFHESDFNTHVLEERRTALIPLKNVKEMGLPASKCTVWRGSLKQEEGKKLHAGTVRNYGLNESQVL